MADININKIQHSVCENGRFQNPWPTWCRPSAQNLFRFVFMDTDKSGVPSQEVIRRYDFLIDTKLIRPYY